MPSQQGALSKTIQFNNSNSLIDLTNKSGSEITAAMWGMTPQTIKDAANVSKMYRSKHGMFSSVPILCQDQDCPYKETCMIDPANRPYGKRCPMEIAAILSRFDQWCAHFDIDSNGTEIDTKDLVDASLIKDLVVTEIQMLRAENKVAINGDFMSETILEIDKKCKVYTGEIISPETEFLLELQDRKIKILNQLNATRKDKSQDKRREAVSDEAIKIFQKIRDLEKYGSSSQDTVTVDISEVEFDDEGNIIIEETPQEEQKEVENNGTDTENTEQSTE